ncbi:MAG: YgiQ family radical SAM protein, partial [Methylococcales bacterium]|nr:YgiQ family radical SAM protein [Methylococcales bacterium]
MTQTAPNLFGYKKFWAQRFGSAPELPMSFEEMEQLGWDSCDIILVTGDAYVDHPSFGMAVIGRVLESQGFRVGIISQPDWTHAEDFRQLGRPNLFFGVTGGNMDSMVNRYTSDKKIRSNDAYTANGEGGKRPDRAVNVYSHRCREAYKNIPIIIGGIEASLRRIAHYDYWSDKVRKSVLMDAKADMLVYGNAERQIVEIAHRLANGELITDLKGIRGTVHFVKQIPADWTEKDSSSVDKPGVINPPTNPYQEQPACDKKLANSDSSTEKVITFTRHIPNKQRSQTVIRLPDFESIKDDPVLYAHASRVMHGETNPGNARPLIQRHGSRQLWINPPPIPLTTKEMDGVFDQPYSRLPHSQYGGANIPAFEMIQHSVNIMRGCFGGCTFCSITE